MHAYGKRFFLIIFLLYIIFFIQKVFLFSFDSTTYNNHFRIFAISSFSDLETSCKIEILYLVSLILAKTNSLNYKWSGNVFV